jgi:pimeloyl-ACP methyl ester carboxylesterase
MAHLRRSGRPVHAVSLTGHGVRRHQAGPEITLSDHVRDVVELIEVMDLVDLTLVGHSYGGRVITRAWSEVRDRVARLVYLDAHAPVDAHLSAAAIAAPPGRPATVACNEFEPDPAVFGGEAGVRWFTERLVEQSTATLTESFHVELPESLDKTFVYAAGDQASRFAPYAELARTLPDWRYLELQSSHWMMLAHPAWVADVILDPEVKRGP